jgi:DNA-binding NarL/FixJ family response regulator
LERDGPPNGLVVNATLAGTSGLRFLRAAHTAYPCMTLLLVSAAIEEKHIACAYNLHASYLTKPIRREQIHAFARLVDPATRLKSSIDGWRVRYGLRDAEVDVFAGAVRGEARDQSAERRGSSPLTIKVHVASLLRRTGDASLHHAVERFLRELARIPESPAP